MGARMEDHSRIGYQPTYFFSLDWRGGVDSRAAVSRISQGHTACCGYRIGGSDHVGGLQHVGGPSDKDGGLLGVHWSGDILQFLSSIALNPC